jgi:hypothetical protein
MEANDELEAGFIADLEAELETDEFMLNEQQKANLEKTTNECQEKLKEVDPGDSLGQFRK